MDRKGFNFYVSYYEVYQELTTHKDKVAFIDALLNKQFKGVDPQGLTGMAKFAYISQHHSIDQQVNGYLDKMGIKLHPPTEGGTQGGTQGGIDPPSQQEKGKGKEKGKEKGQQNGLVMAFNSKEFVETWNLWLNYRKEINKTIKGLSAAQGQQNKLGKLSGGDPSKAVKIIMQSIENNWVGLFDLKNETNEQQTNTPDELKAVVNRLVERHNARNGA
mgnify:CR=1 FL=1